MNNNSDSGKGFLKDKLVGYQQDPPPEVWESISARLGGRGGRRKVIIILSAAASLALAVTLGISYMGRDLPGDRELTSSPEAERVQAREENVPSRKPQESRLEERVVEVLAKHKTPGAKENSPVLAAEFSQEEGSFAVNAQSTLPLKENIDDTNRLPSVEDEPEEVEVELELTEANEKDEDLALDAGDEIGDEIQMDFNETRDRDPRWVLGAVLSPLYSYRDAQPEAVAGTSGQESGTVAYAAGVQVGYRATRRLAIESGILFNKMGISIGAPEIHLFSKDMVYAASGPESGWGRVMAVTNTVGNIVSNSGEIYVNNYLLNATTDNNLPDPVLPQAVNADQGIKQHLDYLELPFNLRYNVLDRDFKIQVLGGISTNFLVNNYVTMESGGLSKEIGYLTNVRSVNYSGNAGLGFVYHILDQLSLSVEPRFRYYLNSVNDATLPSTHPYTFGIYTGINYFF